MGKKDVLKNDGILYAENVQPRYLKSHLCDYGPETCDICISPCAYGRRWLKLFGGRSEKDDVPQVSQKNAGD